MNLKTALLGVRRMNEADRLAVAAGIPVIELMENAGKAVASAIKDRWSPRPIAVLCGSGNNGGDGFVTARLLARAGWPVKIALLGSRDRLTGAARHHADLWRGNVESLSPTVLEGAVLVVDAIFGAGLSRALEGAAKETLAAAARTGLPIVAVDVPSGLMGDTGEALGAVPAVLTVTFFRKKPGHLLLPGRLLCGELVVADIGIPPRVLEQVAPDTFENDPRLWLSDLPSPHDGGNNRTQIPTLLDAAALMAFHDDPAALERALPGPCVLTLHEDEFRRLFDPSGDKLTRTRAAARRSGATNVLNGGDTVIVASDGRAIINCNAPPTFATIDLGEVLGAIMRELLGQGMEPFLGAAAAEWLNGELAADHGPGFISERLPDALAAAFRRLQKSQ
jgi:ADP-dependent NAD(P)H-hydrate dehydratase / NAD(P)H-hydrate epimerase